MSHHPDDILVTAHLRANPLYRPTQADNDAEHDIELRAKIEALIRQQQAALKALISDARTDMFDELDLTVMLDELPSEAMIEQAAKDDVEARAYSEADYRREY